MLIGLAGGAVYFFSSEDGYFRSEVGRGVSAFFKKITPQEVDIPSGDVNVKPWEYITSNNEKTSVNYIRGLTVNDVKNHAKTITFCF